MKSRRSEWKNEFEGLHSTGTEQDSRPYGKRAFGRMPNGFTYQHSQPTPVYTNTPKLTELKCCSNVGKETNTENYVAHRQNNNV